MSVVRGFGLNGKSIYSNVAKPTEVNLEFTVTATNGLGITSLKSNGYVNNVFMHTSTTPTANNGQTNPNPAAGYAIIQLKSNFNAFLNMQTSFQSPNTGSSTTTTANSVYIIRSLGTATTAQWQAKGLPQGLTPAVGQSFVATASGTIGGSATVYTPSLSGAMSAEIVGNPNTEIANSSVAANAGAYVLVQFLGSTITMNSYTPAGTNSAPALTMNSYTPVGTITNGTPDTFAGTPATLTGTVAAPVFTGTPATLTGTITQSVANPADGTVVRMRLYFDGSSVTVDGL